MIQYIEICQQLQAVQLTAGVADKLLLPLSLQSLVQRPDNH
jgi:hypothetical protein